MNRLSLSVRAAARAFARVRAPVSAGVLALLAAAACSITEPPLDSLDSLDEVAWAEVSAGRAHTCALSVEGRVACWGANDRGQLGLDRTSTQEPDPSFVQSPARFTAISAGGRHTCAIDRDRDLWCWGANDIGQLGDGTLKDWDHPVRVEVGGPFLDVSAGENHTCAVRAPGRALCWGANHVGQGGLPPLSSQGLRPTPVAGEIAFAAVGSGAAHSCGVTEGGTAACWGINPDGRLGTGSLVESFVPVSVTGGIAFRTVDAGDAHSCGLDDEGRGWCWGSNRAGQVGPGTEPLHGSPTLRHSGPLHAMEAGDGWSCTLPTEGLVTCWGVRWDQAPEGGRRRVDREGWSPPASGEVGKPMALTVGARHACVLSEDGRIACWGR